MDEARQRKGTIGLAISGLGLAIGAAGLAIGDPRNPLPLTLLIGAALYLIGGFVTVFSVGYRAGTRTFLIQRVMRMGFAAIVIFTILRAANA
jgi:hypothetical protein